VSEGGLATASINLHGSAVGQVARHWRMAQLSVFLLPIPNRGSPVLALFARAGGGTAYTTSVYHGGLAHPFSALVLELPPLRLPHPFDSAQGRLLRFLQGWACQIYTTTRIRFRRHQTRDLRKDATYEHG